MEDFQRKMEEALASATAQAQEMAQRVIQELLQGKMDMSQFQAALAGMMGRVTQGGENPYRVLGLDPSASDEVVKVVYRHLSRKHHPDHGGAPERMAEINRAYETITRERGWGKRSQG